MVHIQKVCFPSALVLVCSTYLCLTRMEGYKETEDQPENTTPGSEKDTKFEDTENHSTGPEIAGFISRYNEREGEDDSSQMQPFCIIQNGTYFDNNCNFFEVL